MSDNTYPDLSNIGIRELHLETANLELAVEWCKAHGLLFAKRVCPSCQNAMKELYNSKGDGLRWRCRKKPCSKEISIRQDTFFNASKLKLTQILDFIYFYSYGLASVSYLKQAVQIDPEAVGHWRSRCREVCQDYFIKNSKRIGGPGQVVEVDEDFLISLKPDVGRVVETPMVFGGIDLSTNDHFLVPVSAANSETLLTVLQKYVKPGSVIVSDLWAAYNILADVHYQHLTVKHDIVFMDPATHGNKRHPKKMWYEAKRKRESEFPWNRATLPFCLVEFMWKKNFTGHCFDEMIKLIRRAHPCV